MPQQVSQTPAFSYLQNLRVDRAWLRSDHRRGLLRRSGLFIVERVDRLLRNRLEIHEFTDQATCVLRISKNRASSYETLADGVGVVPGDPLLELHLWNEHLGVAGSDYSVFAWGVELLKRLRFSLMLLADHVNLNEEWKDVKAVHACFATCLRRPERGFEHLGFSITSPNRSLSTRTHDFFEAFLVHSLIWAFRPCGKRKHPKTLKRVELWLSIARLQDLYGPSAQGLEKTVRATPNFLYEAPCVSNRSKGSRHETVLGTSQL
jgi:hypothetical protein